MPLKFDAPVTLYSMFEVAEELDMNYGAVKKRAHNLNVGHRIGGENGYFRVFTKDDIDIIANARDPRWWSEEGTKHLIDLIQSGATPEEIIEAFPERSRRKIYDKMYRLGYRPDRGWFRE